MAEQEMGFKSASNALRIHIAVVGLETPSQRPSISVQTQTHQTHHREDIRALEDTHSIRILLCRCETHRLRPRRNNRRARDRRR
jgi:hypothetical protein